VIDLTSSLYLGLRHPGASLPEWDTFTLGVPAALQEPPAAAAVGQRLRRLIGTAAARVATSTLHAFVDLGAALSTEPISLGIDTAAYPLGRFGLGQVVRATGAPVTFVAHYDAPSAARWAQRMRAWRLRPILLVDGVCPSCGRAAPLAALCDALSASRGLVVLDDTQAVGLLGRNTGDHHSWGHGGGGSVPHAGGPAEAVVVASLAKALGAPLAVIAGSEDIVRRTRQQGLTWAHASPPSTPVLLAALRGLEVNDRQGDALRRRLLANITTLQRSLSERGVAFQGGCFPVQRLPVDTSHEALRLCERLAARGVRGVPLSGGCRGRPAVGLIVTASHRREDLRRVAAAVAGSLRRAA
jgi:8-amino-7-oxononanoate synthase